MWSRIIGRSNDNVDDDKSRGSRRKDEEQRSSRKPSVSSSTARKPPRGDDRERGINLTSTSYSSSSRGPNPGTASASVASSYATASSNRADDFYLPPGVVRNADRADNTPRTKPDQQERDREDGSKSKSKSERRRDRSPSRGTRGEPRARSRSRDRSDKKREKRDERDRRDKGRGLSRSETGCRDGDGSTRGNFDNQVESSGFTQFPGQYDGVIPGPTSRPPPQQTSAMSAHVQDQFPGQFPKQSTAPYRPPLAASEGGPGLAAE